MFQKIDIQNFGLFNNYRWDDHVGKDLSSSIFKKINIIYGRNYSGKTTLSRIFRWIEMGIPNERYINSQFLITDDNRNTISEKQLICPYKIRVYNTDFIKTNLGWLYDNENGEIKPFTLLGSDNILAAKRIEEIDIELGSIEKQTGLYSELEKQKEKYATIEKSIKVRREKLEQCLQKQANQIIKPNPNYVQQGTNYIVTNIKKEIVEIKKNPQKYLLDEKTILLHKTVIEETEKSHINDIYIKVPNYEEAFNNVKLLIEKKITLSETIQELVTDSLLQKWVDNGRTYHRNKLNRCAFCGGTITADRWEKIDAHFSKESEELKKAIENEKSVLEKSKNYLENYMETEKIVKESYYASFFIEFEELKKKWDDIVNKYSKLMTKLLEKLQERYDDIFNQKNIERMDDISNDIENLVKLFNLLAKRNNEKTTTIDKDKNNSRKLLRDSENARFLLEINYNEEEKMLQNEEEKLSLPKMNIDDLERKITNMEEEKKKKELELNDEGEAAKKVTNHLLNFFGHDGLSLKPEMSDEDKPKTKFIVKRGDENAYNLSEGECSLISFCYFIAKMEDELNGTDHEKLIIYIDDPVSSLDNNHIFFMFSLIETVIAKDKKYAQLFISTHNLDFLKYIKRLTVPQDDNKRELINHFIVEKRKKGSDYRCFLSKMPPYLRDYVTEYNFLFKEIYNIAEPFTKGERTKYFENNFTLLYNLPNNMRRFLECYLFYRFPNTDHPLKNLGKIFNDNIPALVNRVINEYSHLTWGDRGTLVMDISEAETVAKEIIKVVMEDIEHFEALCDSVKVDKNIVLT
jgi:wobble nucleotide-excising tRNase